MDFANRGTRPVGSEGVTSTVSTGGGAHKNAKMGGTRLQRILSVTLLFAGTLLAVAIIILLVFGRTPSEAGFVKKNKYQAVFLNGGQVYFGKIGKFNDKYLTLSDIYYLRVNQTSQNQQSTSNNDVSLAKLGSELHGPEDQMVINRSEVQFWENLKDDGQVVKAITAYKQNPNAANTNSNTNATTNTQSTPTNNTSTNSSTSNTTTTKKP